MFDPSKIKIIFFDVGNVLVSDDPSGCYVYRCLFDHINSDGNLTAEEFFRRRTDHIKDGGGLWSFVGQYVPSSEFKQWQKDVRAQMYSQWTTFSPAIESMAEVPRTLASHYRLGILANQPAEVKDLLADRGLLKYFDTLAISDVLKLYKPDPALYQWALDAAGVKPDEALMVGDRIDNDIVPAKTVGMHTAWLRLGYDNREWRPEDEFQKCYAASIAAVSYSETEPIAEADMPDIMVHSGEELIDTLINVNSQTCPG